MDKVYLETSIISYLVSKPSKDVIILSHQLITEDWWGKSRKNYDLYVSEPAIYDINKIFKKHKEHLDILKEKGFKIITKSNLKSKIKVS